MREFTIVRSQRRTMSLEITADLTVLVRAPHTVSTAVIRNFVDTHERWICKHLAARRAQEGAFCALSEAAIEALKARAKIYIPERVSYFSSIMGVVPSHVKITSARTRFGSCSCKNGLCFSYRLMLYPPPAIDYVVVHELAHITHKNHQSDFYRCIEGILPDYRSRIALLKRGCTNENID